MNDRRFIFARRQIAVETQRGADVSIIVVAKIAVGVEAKTGKTQAVFVVFAERAVGVNFLTIDAAIAKFQQSARLERPRTAFGDDVNHAADGIGAVKRRCRAAHNFDMVDVFDGNLAEIEAPVLRRVGAHAVHQNERLIGIGAARENRSRFAARAALRDRQAGHEPQNIENIEWFFGLDLRPCNHSHGGRRIGQRLRIALGGDDDHFFVVRQIVR